MATVLVPMFAEPGLAADPQDPEIVIDGQIRYRGNADGRDFDQDTEIRQFGELRTRLGLRATPQDRLTIYAQIQDSRILGSNSGGLVNDANVGLHQGYLLYGLGSGLALQAGRFEMSYGNQRLVGTVGWSNVGRTWDGLRLSRECEPRRLDLFWVKRVESTLLIDAAGDPLFDRDVDHDFLGLNLRFKPKNVELFVYVDSDRVPRSTADLPGARDPYEIDRDNVLVTFGAHSGRTFGAGFDYVFNGALQVGSNMWRVPPDTIPPDPPPPEVFEEDVSARMINFELGYTFSVRTKPRLAVMIDYASGDDDLADENVHSFDNLYYTGHAFRGYMDYFLTSSPYGLVDVALRFKMAVSPQWSVRFDAHDFRAATDYPSGEDGEHKDSAIGKEVDLVVTFSDDRVGFESGVGVFDADDAAASYDPVFAGPDNGVWAYSLFSARF
jgi:hypothetical protein